MILRRLRTCASIDHIVSRLHLGPTRQTVGDDIADGVVITPEGKPANLDADNYFIRDGIVVIPKNAVIPAGLWI